MTYVEEINETMKIRQNVLNYVKTQVEKGELVTIPVIRYIEEVFPSEVELIAKAKNILATFEF